MCFGRPPKPKPAPIPPKPTPAPAPPPVEELIPEAPPIPDAPLQKTPEKKAKVTTKKKSIKQQAKGTTQLSTRSAAGTTALSGTKGISSGVNTGGGGTSAPTARATTSTTKKK